MTSYETLLYDERDQVAWVTLNRPESHNAFNVRMQQELRSVWRGLRSNDDVNAVVLSAAGEKAFCVGVDRDEPFIALESDTLYGTSNNFMYDDPGDFLGPKACDLWKPVICAVNGMACGGAFYMIAESDIIIAAEHATFFDPHVTYGLAAVYEPIKMLQRMPLGEVLRMGLVGSYERISAATAMRMGLVSEVVPAEELQEAAGRLAGIIASQPAIAVQGTLRAIWAANDLTRHQALSMAPAILSTATDTRLMAEGVENFSGGLRAKPRTR